MSESLRMEPLPSTLRSLADAEFDEVIESAIVKHPKLRPRPGGSLENGTAHINTRCRTCDGGGEFLFWHPDGYGRDAVIYECPCIDQWYLGALFAFTGIAESLGRLGRKDVGITDEAADLIQPWLSDVKGYSHRGEVLILKGDSGTGKTFLATLIMRAFLSDGYSALLASANDIKGLKIEGFDFPEKRAAFRRKVVNTDLLVVDELGTSAEEATNFMAETLREVVVKRHESERPTILISTKEPGFISSLRSLESMLMIFPILPLSEAKHAQRREDDNREREMGIRRPLVLR